MVKNKPPTRNDIIAHDASKKELPRMMSAFTKIANMSKREATSPRKGRILSPALKRWIDGSPFSTAVESGLYASESHAPAGINTMRLER
jgi:hypothetical protein